ncbi:MAG: response regulator transcription factor [Anaerolineae bacterium]|nr:response regulator transcription factor [Anaerolineae bacterium]
MQTTKTIRVAIVDDHAIVRSGLANFLRAFDDLEFVGEADNGAEALDLCRRLLPDVVLMDLVMPKMSGVEATAAICRKYPSIQVLVLTSFDDENFVQEALRAGAIGYLLKNASIHVMAEAIRSAYAGSSVFSSEATQALVRLRDRTPLPGSDLKEREREVLSLLTQGLTNPQIAETLSLSLSTIKFYVSSILEKLDVETRTEAVARAISCGIVSKTSGFNKA